MNAPAEVSGPRAHQTWLNSPGGGSSCCRIRTGPSLASLPWMLPSVYRRRDAERPEEVLRQHGRVPVQSGTLQEDGRPGRVQSLPSCVRTGELADRTGSEGGQSREARGLRPGRGQMGHRVEVEVMEVFNPVKIWRRTLRLWRSGSKIQFSSSPFEERS